MMLPMGGARIRNVVAVCGLAVTAALSTSCTSQTAAPTPKYYVSVGDSYSVGYQPKPTSGATSGYTGVVAAATGLQLENFGCGGATTASILHATGTCGSNGFGPPAATHAGPSTSEESQIQAADAFISAHRGRIGLVTVSAGGNDVTGCVAARDPVSCVLGAVPSIETNVTTLVNDLRASLASAGARVPIVGLTYPDVVLGRWVNDGGEPSFPPNAANKALASESVLAFSSYINPALKEAYETGRARFIDITQQTGAYISLSTTTSIDLSPLGTITVPVAVAQVCKYSWYCELGSIYANTTGYTFIGNQIVAALR
jgi:lysophospholipase L1-like esterase